MGRADAIRARERARGRREGTVNLTLVTGRPCSGKTTHVAQHKRPGDVVLDYDALAVALGSDDTHDHPPHYLPLIMEAIDAVLKRAARDSHHVWLIKCQPTARDLARATNVVTLDVPADECLRRAIEAGRPTRWTDLITSWVSHM